MENPEDLDLDNNEVLDRIIPKAAKKLVGRRGLMFKPKKQTPYTGWYVEFYEDDAIELLLHYRVGKWDGPARSWYNNGRKEKVIKFKAGKQDGVSLEWYGDGKKKSVVHYTNGKPDGEGTVWYENGCKRSEVITFDGKFSTVFSWKPNGERCPETNFKDGNGTFVLYNEDGGISSHCTYKDGICRETKFPKWWRPWRPHD